MIPWWNNNFGEDCARAAYSSILAKNISQGKVTLQLEDRISKIFRVNNVIAMNSGSSALYAILSCLDLTDDEEVIVQSRTWIATFNSVFLAHKNIKVVDINLNSYCLNLNGLVGAITAKTRVVVIAHMNGRSQDIFEIATLCKSMGIFLIEDAAQAIYSKSSNKYLGTFGDASIFSLSAAKVISSGQGGLALINDNLLARKVRDFRTQGVESTHEPIDWSSVGCNFRYTDVLASIAMIQFNEADERLSTCEQIYLRYKNGLSGCKKLRFMDKNSADEAQTYVEILCETRDILKHFLESRLIETRKFYPPINRSQFMSVPDISEYPNAEFLYRRGIYLPSGPGQSMNDIDLVIEVLQEYDQQF
jgi:dTDP-4-amino-4,6-dideoxygalactose transaminase